MLSAFSLGCSLSVCIFLSIYVYICLSPRVFALCLSVLLSSSGRSNVDTSEAIARAGGSYLLSRLPCLHHAFASQLLPSALTWTKLRSALEMDLPSPLWSETSLPASCWPAWAGACLSCIPELLAQGLSAPPAPFTFVGAPPWGSHRITSFLGIR